MVLLWPLFFVLCVPLAGLVLFSIPWIWLLNKRRVRLKAFGAQLPDALELVARRAGGSMRDAEVIAAANEHGLAMLFTGMRHFRH